MALSSSLYYNTLQQKQHKPLFPKYPSLTHNNKPHFFTPPPTSLQFSSSFSYCKVRATSATVTTLDPELTNGNLESGELFSCPVCYQPLIRKGPPGIDLEAIYRSGFKCRSCDKSYSSKDMFLDLTVTSGMKNFIEIQPTRSELFRQGGLIAQKTVDDLPFFFVVVVVRSPVVSFLYERGWRQSFNRSGFPGPDEEFIMAQEYFKPVEGGVLVDVSCGSGLFSRKFATSGSYSNVIALDYSENMLRQNLALVRADVSRLPFQSGSIDAVHAGAAIHCWPSPSNAIAEICRVLRSGGVFVGSTFLRYTSSMPWILRPLRQRILQNYAYYIEEEIEDLYVFKVRNDYVEPALPWDKIRVSLKVGNDQSNNSTLILAANRTDRRDPIDDFNIYYGGWNISNSHYWASVGFTAVPLVVIAASWFVIFALSLCFICICYCCCRKESYGYSQTCYTISLFSLILFTIATLVGCILLYTGQGKFHSSTTNVLDYVTNQAQNITNTLRNISEYLESAKGVGVNSLSLAPDAQNTIAAVSEKVNYAATTLESVTANNKVKIKNGLDHFGLSLIIVSAVMLILAILGFLCSVLGWQCVVYFLVVIGWILVTCTFILSGSFLLLHNVIADTCVSMDEWVQHPAAHTALDDIIPCIDSTTSQETLKASKNITNQLLTMVNQVIVQVCNQDVVNIPPQYRKPPIYFNQSGPLMPIICSVYNTDLSDRTCEPGEVDMKDASQVWKNYTCQLSGNMCATTGRLTPDMYGNFSALTNISYGLVYYGPFLVNMVDCTFVRDIFTDISVTYCPGLRRYTQWIYIGLVVLSSAVMLSLIFWVIYARERSHRIHTQSYMGTAY
ncbi:hypothetical protein ACFE04_009099 [Oxalis oulophora]